MGTLGRITLKFGATGEADVEPLAFEAGHVNLVVGPNNAGKSLFLRELAHIDPRGGRGPRFARERRDETRIIADVGWAAAVDDTVRADAIAEALADERWQDVEERRWSVLVPALRQAASELTAQRARFASVVLPLAMERIGLEGPLAPILRMITSNTEESGGFDGIVLWGALAFLLLNTEIDANADDESIEDGQDWEEERALASVDAEQTPNTSSPEAITGESGSAREESDDASEAAADAEALALLRTLLDAYWTTACQSFDRLRIATADLSLVDVIEQRLAVSFIADRVRQTPLVFFFDLSQVPEIPPLPDSAVRTRCERIGRLIDWMADPRPLVRLAADLEEHHAARTWANPETRRWLAEQSLYLDGLTRLSMTDSASLRGYEQAANDAPPILALLRSPERMALLRPLVTDALGAYLVIDMVTHAPSVVWRLSRDEPPEGAETSYSEIANAYHREAPPLVDQSDGIHAIIGMLAAIIAGDAPLVFIDEPEAFLHPPLVRKLARLLGQIAQQSGRQFFIATHSPEMLASAAMSGVDVNVIRLTWRDDIATARLLDSTTLSALALDPLMRSESALSALFHDGAVVCESAADRVLYQEINERLVRHDDHGAGGLESVVFLDAQNWQTIPRIVEPLRKVGVAAAAIIDADALTGRELPTVLDAACMPKRLREAVLQTRTDLRNAIAQRCRVEPRSVKLKRDVIDGLTRPEREEFEDIRSHCARYGVFVVPVGELEDWLRDLDLPSAKDKARWFRRALEGLGRDPTGEGYVWPAADDIWGFVRGIVRWVQDPERAGTRPRHRAQ